MTEKRGEPFEVEKKASGVFVFTPGVPDEPGRYLCIPLLEGERLKGTYEIRHYDMDVQCVTVHLTREPAHQERGEDRRKGERRVARKRVHIRGAASNTIPTDTGGRRDIWNQRRKQGERRGAFKPTPPTPDCTVCMGQPQGFCVRCGRV